jgi:hypothetical protein
MLDALQQLIVKEPNFVNTVFLFPLIGLIYIIVGDATCRRIQGNDSYGSAWLQSFRDSFGPSTVRRCAGKTTFSHQHLTSTHNAFAG